MDLGPIMDDPTYVKWNRKDRGALVRGGAALEVSALAAAGDLQPVVALLSTGGDISPDARLLVCRAFDTLVAALDTAGFTAPVDHG